MEREDYAEKMGKLFEEYKGAIFGMVYLATRNREDAEDLTSEAFLRVARQADYNGKNDVELAKIIFRTARNLTRNYYRDNSRHPQTALDPETHVFTEPGPEAQVIKNDMNMRLLGMIRQLPESQREALYLRYGVKMGNEEAGQLMGKSEGAMKSLVTRGLKKLAKKMNKEDF